MTTTTDDTAVEATDEIEAAEPELIWVSVHNLIPHPDNPRKHPGDITEMVRSVKAKGVIEPVTLLPADDDGHHMVVCGFRRRAATLEAVETVPEVEIMPAVVRHWSRSEALDAMFIENLNRASLTVSEEIAGIELAMSLDAGCTPARLCRRIGKSQAWVRSRMSLVVLPTDWREAIDAGRLSVTEAEAIASAADLGPEHIEALCEQMADRRNGDPARSVERYRDDLRIAAEYDAVLTEQNAGPHPVYTADDPAPSSHRTVRDLFDEADADAHASQPCHAVVVRRPSTFVVGGPVTVVPICTQPRRHSAAQGPSGRGSSDLTSDRVSAGTRNGDDSAAKRRGRVARVTHAKEVFARSRGGVNQRDLTEAALRALVEQAGADPLAFAATILGYEEPRNVRASTMLADADTPAALIRVAGAVAFGLAENHMYHSPQACGDYLRALTGTGWEPDEWTAAALGQSSGSEPDSVGHGDESDPADEDDGPDEDDESDPADEVEAGSDDEPEDLDG
jgi:ParB/RepB/Spo0J family partition protein